MSEWERWPSWLWCNLVWIAMKNRSFLNLIVCCSIFCSRSIFTYSRTAPVRVPDPGFISATCSVLRFLTVDLFSAPKVLSWHREPKVAPVGDSPDQILFDVCSSLLAVFCSLILVFAPGFGYACCSVSERARLPWFLRLVNFVIASTLPECARGSVPWVERPRLSGSWKTSLPSVLDFDLAGPGSSLVSQ
jgi:hypothetical protein